MSEANPKAKTLGDTQQGPPDRRQQEAGGEPGKLCCPLAGKGRGRVFPLQTSASSKSQWAERVMMVMLPHAAAALWLSRPVP